MKSRIKPYSAHKIRRNLKVDAETQGVVQYTFPIKLLPPRGRYPLEMKIHYNSTGSNGNCGMGWNLSEIFVEQTVEGLFLVEDRVRTELVPADGEDNTYRPKREQVYRLVRPVCGVLSMFGWEMNDAIGNTYLLNARFQFGHANETVIRWYPTHRALLLTPGVAS